jgi:hypothetical protein
LSATTLPDSSPIHFSLVCDQLLSYIYHFIHHTTIMNTVSSVEVHIARHRLLTCASGQISRVRFESKRPNRIALPLTLPLQTATVGVSSSSQVAAHTTLPRRASTRIVPSAQKQTTRDACKPANFRTATLCLLKNKTVTQMRAKKQPKTCHPPPVTQPRVVLKVSRARHHTGARKAIASAEPGQKERFVS